MADFFILANNLTGTESYAQMATAASYIGKINETRNSYAGNVGEAKMCVVGCYSSGSTTPNTMLWCSLSPSVVYRVSRSNNWNMNYTLTSVPWTPDGETTPMYVNVQSWGTNPNMGDLQYPVFNTEAEARLAAWQFLTGSVETDPYAPGGNSGTGGGTGNFDLTSDQISVPNVPTLSAVDTGLVTLYTPTLAQLQSLARYLWNADATTVDWWKKLIANPLDLVLGLSIVPVAVPQGATENVYVGLIDTGIAMTKAASQYVQVDCGSLNITEFYGAALDYLPFRKTSIYLPFIGTRTISTDDIMGKTVQVVYNIDLLSGALTAMVKCGDAVLYQYSGACNIAIPLSGQSFTDLALSTLQLAAGIGATVATGGAVAGVVAANAANSVMSMKPTIERAGGVSGAAGQLAIMRPYLIGEIPRQSVPKNYNKFAGYPSNVSALLGDLEGYTEVETIYLEGITATSDELIEIENLLKSGVFI